MKIDKTYKLVKILFFTFSSLLIIIIFLQYFKVIRIQDWIYPKVNLNNSVSRNNPDYLSSKKIARVGGEDIFQSDLDYEIESYPLRKADINKILLQKLVKDSIIIQNAHKEGLIKIDRSVYNSPDKNYLKRIELVNSIKKMLNNRKKTTSGYFISIWFLNKFPGELGYERAKEIAFAKINLLHLQVKSNQISILEAAQKIIDDKDLSRIDPDFSTNALSAFQTTDDEKITHDAEFDKVIKSLGIGEVSDVFPVKDLAEGSSEQVETSYRFAQVTEQKNTLNSIDFESWYKKAEKNYEVINY